MYPPKKFHRFYHQANEVVLVRVLIYLNLPDAVNWTYNLLCNTPNTHQNQTHIFHIPNKVEDLIGFRIVEKLTIRRVYVPNNWF